MRVDTQMQATLDDNTTYDFNASYKVPIKPGDGILIDKNAAGDGVEVKVDPAKKYLSFGDLNDYTVPVKNVAGGGGNWVGVSYGPDSAAYRVVQRDGNGDFTANHIYVGLPTALYQVSRVYEVGEVVSITAAAGVTSGTLTENQLQSINRRICSLTGGYNNNTWILFNKERYYPMSYEHQTNYYVYTNVEYEDNNVTVKAITVNLKTGAWVLNTMTPTPKLYMHNVAFSVLGGGSFTGVFISADNAAYTHETIVGKRSVSVYNSNGYEGGLITNVYINGLSGSDLDANITVNNSLTYALANMETIAIVSDTVNAL